MGSLDPWRSVRRTDGLVGVCAARRRPRLPNHLAVDRHGVLTSSDLTAHGMSRAAIEHAVASGELVRQARGVFVVPGSPGSVEQRAVVATLALRGALSHACAAGWWGLPGFEVTPLQVMRFRPGSSKQSPLARLHRPVRLLPQHLTEWRGVPVTRPARTLFDLAAVEHPGRVERTYDTMWSRGLVNPRLMDRTLAELQGRGRPGIQLMRRLIDDRRGLDQPTGSRLERRFERLNEQAGIPMLRRQVEVGVDDWVGRMDFVGLERALVVEVDSEIHHAALLDVRRDRSVTRRLESAGWHVLRLREDDVWNRGAWVVDRLERAWWAAPARS
jgi:very-short-patch-repair endonuclease